MKKSNIKKINKNKKQCKRKNNRKNAKTSKNIFKKWYFWGILLILLGLTIFLAIFIPKKIKDQKLLEQEMEISTEIENCVSGIGFDSLEFKTTCYESMGRSVPDDVKKSDMQKVDMILAQSEYDKCRAFASLVYDALWDINDDIPENLALDSIDNYHINFINTSYHDSLKSCDEKYALTNPYNDNWDTFIKYRLSGWIHDYNNIQVFDLENSQGKIAEASGIRADERTTAIPKGVGSVAYMIAYNFRQKHNNWWY